MRRITLRVKQISESLISALKQIPGVQEVKTAPAPNSLLSIEAFSEVDSNLNEQTAKVVIQKGAGLLELSESFNLEDVFLKLTSKEGSKESHKEGHKENHTKATT